jgi:hypothetical protein
MTMPEDDEPLDLPVEDSTPEASASDEVDEQEMGDFITRHVLEKDSVFFEG